MNVFDSIYSIIMILIFSGIAISLIYEKKARISPTPVLPAVRAKVMAMLDAQNMNPENIADLGCGWGGLVLKLQRLYPVSRVTGFEISPLPYWASRLRTTLSSRIDIMRESFFDKDISGNDIVTCYLSPYHMEKLKPQLENLKSGSVVISCSFPIKDWIPVQTEYVRGIFVMIPVFMYIIK